MISGDSSASDDQPKQVSKEELSTVDETFDTILYNMTLTVFFSRYQQDWPA